MNLTKGQTGNIVFHYPQGYLCIVRWKCHCYCGYLEIKFELRSCDSFELGKWCVLQCLLLGEDINWMFQSTPSHKPPAHTRHRKTLIRTSRQRRSSAFLKVASTLPWAFWLTSWRRNAPLQLTQCPLYLASLLTHRQVIFISDTKDPTFSELYTTRASGNIDPGVPL